MAQILGAALAPGGFVAVVLVLATYGRCRWAETTQALLGQLEAARLPATCSPYNAHLDTLDASEPRFRDWRGQSCGGDPLPILLNGRVPMRGDRVGSP